MSVQTCGVLFLLVIVAIAIYPKATAEFLVDLIAPLFNWPFVSKNRFV